MLAGDDVKSHALPATGDVTVGRGTTCEITIDHPTLSRRHAVLRLGPPLTVQDLGSTNGERVSRQTLHGGAPFTLEAGETFHIGGFAFNDIGRGEGTPSSSQPSWALQPLSVQVTSPPASQPHMLQPSLDGKRSPISCALPA